MCNNRNKPVPIQKEVKLSPSKSDILDTCGHYHTCVAFFSNLHNRGR